MMSSHTEFEQAIQTKNLYEAEERLAELPRIEHQHRAAVLLLIMDLDPDRYQRAARRWIGRLLEDPRCRLGLADIASIASALESLPIVDAARLELADILERAGLRATASVFAPPLVP